VSKDALVLRVADVIPSTPSTRIVRVDLAGSSFAYEAGQAAMIGLADHDGRVPYSIASAPAESAKFGWLEFLIKVEPSGRWGHRFEGIAPGDELGIRGPYGSFIFPARPREDRFLFIAGGTGISPIRAMIVQALMTQVPGRMQLLYSAKTGDDFAYLGELGEIASTNANLGLHLHVTREESDDRPIGPRVSRTERGRITLNQLAPLLDNPATLCFVCGPETMVAAVPRMLRELGVESGRIRLEEW
jgi:stearoyl-CoA 9-desaturase NADPH oxidoreductase